MKDEARLGAALRENLRRRKAQVRARDRAAETLPAEQEAGPAKAGAKPESAGRTPPFRFRGTDGQEKI